MRTTLLDDMPQGARGQETSEPQDVTLGLTALLGIFLAVVLVCAVFFGFGYSTGRTLHGGKNAGAAAAQGGSADAAAGATGVGGGALAAAPPVSASQIAKPSPAAALTETAPAASLEGSTPGRPVTASSGLDGSRQERPVIESDASPAEYPAMRAGASVRAPAAAGSGVMVQIAAVVHQADADALAKALRRNGYSAVVRAEPQDSFLHVQVGPFETRDEARVMRARLQADGYNAFMKP